MAYSPDGRILATGSFDGTHRLWEVSGGNLLMEADGHFDSVQRVAFTPDGTRLASGSREGAISLWGIPVIQ